MALDLFAGSPVSDYEAAKPWYEHLLGGEPSFIPHATEAVWELAEHRYLFHPGKARKVTYRDADGNEISFGGPVDSAGS